MAVTKLLGIAEIPADLRLGETDGKNIAHLASGVHFELDSSGVPNGGDAGLRLVHAGFRFRTAEIGRRLVASKSELSAALNDDPQLVEFAGGFAAATSLVAALDLAASALYRLHFGTPDPTDPRREVDLGWFPKASLLPPLARKWLVDTQQSPKLRTLQSVRDYFIHRHFPIHATVSLGSAGAPINSVEVDGRKETIQNLLDEARDFVIDRLVTVGLLMRHSKSP
jgi:hypothetical protein